MAHLTQEEYNQGKKDIWSTTILLSIVTIVEVLGSIAYEHYVDSTRIPLMIFVVVASVIKAYYIMKVFMHVGHEKKGFAFTLLYPFFFLTWFIIAFAAEGSSIHAMRQILNGVFY